MRLLDNLTHVSQPADRHLIRAGITLAAAVVIFLLALAGFIIIHSLLLYYILWAIGSVLVGVAVMQARWFRRFVEWGIPKTERSRRIQGNTAMVLAILAAILLVISLLYR
jgi:hypothetical protein